MTVEEERARIRASEFHSDPRGILPEYRFQTKAEEPDQGHFQERPVDERWLPMLPSPGSGDSKGAEAQARLRQLALNSRYEKEYQKGIQSNRKAQGLTLGDAKGFGSTTRREDGRSSTGFKRHGLFAKRVNKPGNYSMQKIPSWEEMKAEKKKKYGYEHYWDFKHVPGMLGHIAKGFALDLARLPFVTAAGATGQSPDRLLGWGDQPSFTEDFINMFRDPAHTAKSIGGNFANSALAVFGPKMARGAAKGTVGAARAVAPVVAATARAAARGGARLTGAPLLDSLVPRGVTGNIFREWVPIEGYPNGGTWMNKVNPEQKAIRVKALTEEPIIQHSPGSGRFFVKYHPRSGPYAKLSKTEILKRLDPYRWKEEIAGGGETRGHYVPINITPGSRLQAIVERMGEIKTELVQLKYNKLTKRDQNIGRDFDPAKGKVTKRAAEKSKLVNELNKLDEQRAHLWGPQFRHKEFGGHTVMFDPMRVGRYIKQKTGGPIPSLGSAGATHVKSGSGPAYNQAILAEMAKEPLSIRKHGQPRDRSTKQQPTNQTELIRHEGKHGEQAAYGFEPSGFEKFLIWLVKGKKDKTGTYREWDTATQEMLSNWEGAGSLRTAIEELVRTQEYSGLSKAQSRRGNILGQAADKFLKRGKRVPFRAKSRELVKEKSQKQRDFDLMKAVMTLGARHPPATKTPFAVDPPPAIPPHIAASLMNDIQKIHAQRFKKDPYHSPPMINTQVPDSAHASPEWVRDVVDYFQSEEGARKVGKDAFLPGERNKDIIFKDWDGKNP